MLVIFKFYILFNYKKIKIYHYKKYLMNYSKKKKK